MTFTFVYMFSNKSSPFRMEYGLDSGSFLKVLCKMVNRRGLSEEVLSDNGTNFVGANKELCGLLKQMTKDSKVDESLVKQGVKWTFNHHMHPILEVCLKR